MYFTYYELFEKNVPHGPITAALTVGLFIFWLFEIFKAVKEKIKKKEKVNWKKLIPISFLMLLLAFAYSDYQNVIRLDNCKVRGVMQLFDAGIYFVEEGNLESFSEVKGEYWNYRVNGRNYQTCVKNSKIHERIRKEKRFDEIGDKVRITYVYQEQNDDFIREIIRLEVFDEDANMKNR